MGNASDHEAIVKLMRAGHGNYVFGLKGKLSADFLICHAVPDDAWWVIPADALGDPAHITSLALCLSPRRRFTRAETLNIFRDAWHVFG